MDVLWTMITAKKPSLREMWLLVSSGARARGKEARIIILAFYF